MVPSNARSPSQLSNAAQAGSSQQSHTSDKENAPPATPPRRPVPVFAGTPPPSQPEAPTFPQEWLTLCDAICTSLTKNFSKYPPHTLQRLAELVLEPKKHYRFLPSYLRALDRTVSVTSSTIIFPFPQATLPSTAGFLNGTVTPPQSTLGSDESLGGALLTPIPWLANRPAGSPDSTEMADAPSGAGRIETVAVVNGQLISQDSRQQGEISSQFGGEGSGAERPISQGELLRQEQEAGLTLSNPHQVHPPRRRLEETGSGQQGAGVMESVEGTQQIDEEEEESPHARGPEEIGVEDTGPQRGGTPGKFDYAEAAGRKRRSPRRSPEADAEQGIGSGGDTKDQKMGNEEGKEKKNQDDDMNEDEKVSEEEKMEEDAILQQDVKDQEMQEAEGKPENEVEERGGKAELEAA